VGLRARLTLTNQRRRIDKNRTRRLPARYSLTPGAQVRSNNRTSPINRTRNYYRMPFPGNSSSVSHLDPEVHIMSHHLY
jgi:hypothetical protein